MAKVIGPIWEGLMRGVCEAWGIELPHLTNEIRVEVKRNFVPVLITVQRVKGIEGEWKTVTTEWFKTKDTDAQ